MRRPDRPARIADYSGRGALASWLRVAAVRVALSHRARPDEAQLPGDDAMVAGDSAPVISAIERSSPARDRVR